MKGVERCLKYVDDVITGDIPAPQTVIHACNRFLEDFKNPEIWFDVEAAESAVRSIENLKHAKGRWQGQSMRLEPFQCFLVCNRCVWKGTKTKFRRFRYCYLQLPRKNGKSLLGIQVW